MRLEQRVEHAKEIVAAADALLICINRGDYELDAKLGVALELGGLEGIKKLFPL